MLKKAVSLLMLFMIQVIFSSCCIQMSGNEADKTSEAESVSLEATDFTEAEPSEATVTEAITKESTTVASEVYVSEIVTEPVSSAVAEATSPSEENISNWSTEKVIAFYKNAASQSSSVKSRQTIGLQDISVNNGQLSGVFSFVTPILSSFLSSSSTETDGITGNFSLLSAEDVSSASVYENEDGIVVEIAFKEESDRADNIFECRVAHGISVVEDLPSIMSQLNEKGLPINIDEENTVITYKNPIIKALISQEGVIIRGTWSCIVEISLSDYKFAGAPVDSTRVVLENRIVVNGGFNG